MKQTFEITHPEILPVEKKRYIDDRTDTTMIQRTADIADLIALDACSSYHRIPRERFTKSYPFTHLRALTDYARLRAAIEVDTDSFDFTIFDEPAVEEWKSWQRYRHEEIVDYANDLASRFEGVCVCITLPDN